LRGGCGLSGGGRSSREEAVRRGGKETVHRGREFVERCSSMWWEGRTMNFRIGKFKIQHDRTMSEFERTSMNCGSRLIRKMTHCLIELTCTCLAYMSLMSGLGLTRPYK